MDRVEAIAARALARLAAAPSPGASGGAPSGALRITRVDMPQLVRLVYLQAGEPLVDQVLAALKAGRPVYLDRPAIEADLGLRDYPPRLQEQFSRWFSRLSGYGIALVGREAPTKTSFMAQTPPAAFDHFVQVSPRQEAAAAPRDTVARPGSSSASTAASVLIPERQIFSEILGDAVPEPHPCVKEPGVMCCGSGRCKTLGF